MRIRWLILSLNDMKEISEFIGQRNERAAGKTVNSIRENVNKLQSHSGLGRPGRVPGTRELLINPFIVPYRVQKEEIQILRVLHTSRKWPIDFEYGFLKHNNISALMLPRFLM